MKRALLLVVFLVSFISLSSLTLHSQGVRKMTNRDQAVICEAEAVKSPSPKIIIRWEKHELAKSYRIQRKSIFSNIWSADIANLDSNQTFFEDINVEPGVIYEYKVFAFCRGIIEGKENNFFAFGYVCSGIDAVLPEPGKLLVLVDKTLYNGLINEIEQYEDDLVREGWHVVIKKCPRAETFNKDAVAEVKSIILQEAAEKMTIFLVGRVPVPYSGNLNPDGHGNHIGAWPSDPYYGDENTSGWTDYSVNNSSASRQENKNVPGDGKFDQSRLPSNLKYLVGRVDFFNMPEFDKNELELLKQYFDKDHKYRIGLTATVSKCVVDDNFKSLIEGFSTSGWRMAPLVGIENISAKDFMTSLEAESLLWAYGTGGGSYTSAGGIGKTADFASKELNGTFTMLFGSYFGDWDIKNNFLRAPLASSPSILTCSWAGRPQWYFHHMGIGLPIGFSALKTENNLNEYIPNYLYTAQYPNGVIYSIGMKQVHQEFLGDPTLRINMGESPEVKTMSVRQPDGQPVNISWDRVFEDNLGYNLYKSVSGRNGPYVKLNDELLTKTRYTDSVLFEGEAFYMVRTVISSETPSGTFLNESRGLIKSLVTTDIDVSDYDVSIKCTPIPAVEFVDISLNLPVVSSVKMSIIDINGVQVHSLLNENLVQGQHSLSWNLRDAVGKKVGAGMYFLRANINGRNYIYKIPIIP